MRGMHPAEVRRWLYWGSNMWPECLSIRSLALMHCYNPEVGSFGSFLYVLLLLIKIISSHHLYKTPML